MSKIVFAGLQAYGHLFPMVPLALECANAGHDGSSRLMVLATYRDTEIRGREALSSALASLAREDVVTRVRLVGLTEAEVAAQLHALAGAPVDRHVTATVSRRTHGNPFFVAELGRVLHGDLASLPEGIRDAVRTRLHALSPVCRAVIDVASVLGPELDPAVLTVVLDRLRCANTPPTASDDPNCQRDVVQAKWWWRASGRVRLDEVIAALDEAADAGVISGSAGWGSSAGAFGTAAARSGPVPSAGAGSAGAGSVSSVGGDVGSASAGAGVGPVSAGAGIGSGSAGGGPGSGSVGWRFTHDLVRDAVRLDLPTTERLAIHRQVAAHLEGCDGTETAALAVSAGAMADRLGMKRLSRDARTLAGAAPGPLTKREQEIAALVAQGLTNKQIAATAHLSVRTVETHVQNILGKLGVATRTQIAVWMASRPL